MNKNQSENQFGSKSKRPSLPIGKNSSYKDLKTAAHEYAEDFRKQDRGFGFSKHQQMESEQLAYQGVIKSPGRLTANDH